MTISSLALSNVVIMLILVSFNLNVRMIDAQVAPQPIFIAVTIRNQLIHLDLQIDCKNNRNKDELKQTVPADGSWTFKFLPILFHDISYSCIFSWNDGKNQSHNYQIYNQGRDEKLCHQECDWEIHETGPCRVSGKRAPECHPWDRPM
ncbi:hypothetical protein HN51_071230 [Arachis hypogaea]|uniref:S-protein homolog n=1 Tax=Arachis hypogaea TaxID=3818 RepID=A0A444YYW8_ARAHY|nr:S-protein homolog 5-like [Arachis ipaensis]QHO13804.1 Leguminosin secreted peptide [Arachis hypogaea]RYR07130.1 hypothetical protein Ahy_B05g074452 [Arachis hypogaea]